jgi:excinuclease ABC subunit A
MTIADVLDLSVEQAVDAFKAQNAIRRPLELLRDVGLGYIKLGQQSPTLSGGEAQRIKLVSELAKVKTDPGNDGSAKTNSTLYVLDEPTIGLHMADVEKLLNVLHRLVQAGHTVVVIEHNLDVVAEADWIVDLGPEGGDGGGQVVAEGTPEQLTADPGQSHTARMLAEFLSDRTAPQRD